jgi:carboxymethylenebutenolidase
MKEIKKEEIKQEVFDLYDDYAHNRIDRRLFMDRLSTYAVGGITVASLLSFISPNYHIIQVQSNDPRLKSEFINYDSVKEVVLSEVCAPGSKGVTRSRVHETGLICISRM